MTGKSVADETLDLLARKQNDLFQRVREGALDPEWVLTALQRIIEGSFGGITINCDAPIPKRLKEGFTRREEDQVGSRVGGTVTVSADRPFDLFRVDGQKNGLDLLEDLRSLGTPVYGIAALEQMHQGGLIPDSLKGQLIFAWGDVLRDGDDNRCVRCIHWGGGRWRWLCYWLGHDWSPNDPAAVRASSA